MKRIFSGWIGEFEIPKLEIIESPRGRFVAVEEIFVYRTFSKRKVGLFIFYFVRLKLIQNELTNGRSNLRYTIICKRFSIGRRNLEVQWVIG